MSVKASLMLAVVAAALITPAASARHDPSAASSGQTTAALLRPADSAANPRRRPPTRLWYRVAVEWQAGEDLEINVTHRYKGEVIDQRLGQRHRRITLWTAKTAESILLRKQPDGSVSFISNGAGSAEITHTGDRTHDVLGWEEIYSGASTPCLQQVKETLNATTPATIAFARTGSGGNTGITVELEPVPVKIEAAEVVCSYTNKVRGGIPVTRTQQGGSGEALCCLVNQGDGPYILTLTMSRAGRYFGRRMIEFGTEEEKDLASRSESVNDP